MVIFHGYVGQWVGSVSQLMQVAPADFLTYGYGSCTVQISGTSVPSGDVKDFHAFSLIGGCLWIDLQTMLIISYYVFRSPQKICARGLETTNQG